MPLRPIGAMERGRSEMLGHLLLAQLDAVNGLSPFCQADLEALLAVEKQKDVIGCDDQTCMSELGGALGSDFVLYGSVGRLSTSYELSVTVVAAHSTTVAARLARVVPEQDAQLEAAVGDAVAELVERLNR